MTVRFTDYSFLLVFHDQLHGCENLPSCWKILQVFLEKEMQATVCSRVRRHLHQKSVFFEPSPPQPVRQIIGDGGLADSAFWSAYAGASFIFRQGFSWHGHLFSLINISI